MPKNLLLADDSKTIQQAIQMTFAREDVALTVVEDGEAALQRAKALKPDLILADVSMPKLGGYDLCQRVRADAGLKHIPVLLLGGGGPVDPAKAIAVGANGHMPKPFDSGKLIEQVKQILANPGAKPVMTPAAAAPARPTAPPPRPSAAPVGTGSTMVMARPAAPGSRPPSAPPPAGARPPAPGAPRPPGTGVPPGAPRPPSPASRPAPPPAATAKLGGPPPTRQSDPPAARPAAPPVRPSITPPPRPAAPPARPPPSASRPPPPKAPIELEEDIPMDEEVVEAPTSHPSLRAVPPPPPTPKPNLSVVPPPGRPSATGGDGGEALLREALSRASREVIEKIAWEVVPELAETIIREELERLIKERGV